MNLSGTISPKSDQLNADDLIAGPRTVVIESVRVTEGEQPVSIRFKGDTGRPYKPSKGMRRVLILLWGDDGEKYIGRSLTLKRDPSIRYGGKAVGGIVITHASDIEEPIQISLTVSKGKREPFTVQPLLAGAPKVQLANLPPAWDSWSLEERGENRATLGTDALREWFGTLTRQDKLALAGKMDGWKKTAAEVSQ